jgi:hypothetical protein
MKLATRVAMVLTAAALVLPAAASAQTSHAKASTADVTRHVKQAHRALKRVQAWAGSDAAYARRALRQNRHETAAASRAARQLRAAGGPAAAASALSQVARQYDQNFGAYGSLLDGVAGDLQSALAQALQPALNGRQQALTALQQVIGQLPVDQRLIPSQLIASIANGTPSQVGDLAGLLDGDGLSQQLQELISQALATASGLVESGIAQLQSLIPTLPAGAQQILDQALSLVTGQLDDMLGLLQQVLGVVPTTIGGVTNIVSSQINQVMGIIEQVLGGGLGGLLGNGSGSGSSSAGCTSTVPVPSFLNGLLGNLLGCRPASA